MARIKANIRRNTQYAASTTEQQPILQTGNLVMNLNEYSVTKGGCKIELASKEFEILKLLLQNPKKVYTKKQIYSLVWNDTYLGFYDILSQKDFDVDLFIPETAIFVQGDKEALQRILYNLLSNVIRYGSDGKYLGVFFRNETASGDCPCHIVQAGVSYP